MKKLYSALFLVFILYTISAQDVLWQKDIQSSTQDFLSTMSITLDRQIVLSGSAIQKSKLSGVSTSGATSTNAGYDYRLLKLSQDGNILWDKHFGGSRHDYLVSATTTREGGFLLNGTSYSNQSLDKKDNNIGGSDIWLIRLNEDGEELWQKTLGTKNNDEAAAVTQSIDEGFFVAGNINSNKGLFESKDVFVSKLDKTGKLINTTILGGNNLDEVQEMFATPDGGSILLIYSISGKIQNKIFNTLKTEQGNSENKAIDLLVSSKGETEDKILIGKTEDNFGEGDYWIVKLDKNANVEWQKTYGGSADDYPKTIVFTDKGYLIGGESRSNSSGNKRENIEEGSDLWLISLDKNGNELWQKSYSFGNRDVLMSVNVIRKTNKDNFSEDKGFLLGGYTQAEGKIKSNDEKFWMLYINSEGKEEWRKHVEGKSKKKEERLVSVKLQTDGTFLLAGTSAKELGKENWKILKLGDKDVENLIEKQEIRIYPNPVDDYCYVEIGLDFKEADIALYDMTGKLIQNIKTKNTVTKINASALPQGVYVVTAKTENKVVNSKIVKK
ncbi:T9SS type A sorting domain-containing protein [Kaistella yonginensis]|uniref:T9SS type A sorting domain-containing protein n=1 Tax=Kaistella yonginensis TaxID=658267 RepID=UPI0025B5CDEF|nr:T9SS type A sorting domain-containing protein [Kaistella yonginensis]MDN3607200.1 T9SS type A sorting domain-containing protein [Kaistella yonginensis]